MFIKKKEARNFISAQNVTIEPFEEVYNNFPHFEIKKKPDNIYSFLNILVFIFPILLPNKVQSNEFFFFDIRTNANKIKWIIKYLVFLGEFSQAIITFALINTFFILINTMKSLEGKERRREQKTLIYQHMGITRKNQFQSEDVISELKNKSKNICELNDDKKIIRDYYISINVNLIIEGKKYNTRRINLLYYIFIKIRFQLGINHFNYINRYIYIYIIKFKFFKQRTNPNKFSKFCFYYSKFISSKINGYYYFIRADIIITGNNDKNKCKQTLENILQIKRKEHLMKYLYDILNILDNVNNLAYLFNLFNEIIFVNSEISIIIELYIIILNKIKKKEENGISFIFIQKRIILKYLPTSENELFEIKNIMANKFKIIKYKNDDIDISQRNKGKIFLIRNIKINCIKIIKYIILFNLFNNIILNNKISLIEYKSYNITLKIKGIGIKKIFSSNSNFKSENYPNEVYINGYKNNTVTFSYY